MIVVGGSASPKLAARVAKLLKCPLVKPVLKRFPDGELYLRFPHDIAREHAVIVQSTPHPQNDNLIELLLMLDTAKDLGASEVTAVVPYLAYARQDKRFQPQEAVSLHTVLRLLKAVGASKLLTVDIHEEKSVRGSPISIKNLSAMPLLGKHLGRLGLKDPAVLGGDQGAKERARMVAEEMGATYDYLEKKRVTPTRVTTKPKSLKVEGRDVIIVDDIISTGGTMVTAAKILKRQGARRIYVACTHGILAGDSPQKLRAAGVEKIIATDTIERKESSVSIAPLIAQALDMA